MICDVSEFIRAIREDSAAWPPEQPKWFRGEPESTTPLLPTLYRRNLGAHENPLLQMFRARASGYHDVVPICENTDQWLFLARHAGLPTRLLDWSEGSLLGLHFALQEKEPVVWMLNPLHLNYFARGAAANENPNDAREFPLTWFDPPPPKINIGTVNIRGAWEHDRPGVALPVAVYPTYVHSRLRGQRACFTVHGKQKVGLNSLVPSAILKRYVISPKHCREMRQELLLLGVTDSVAFPELDGLARELTERFS